MKTVSCELDYPAGGHDERLVRVSRAIADARMGLPVRLIGSAPEDELWMVSAEFVNAHWLQACEGRAFELAVSARRGQALGLDDHAGVHLLSSAKPFSLALIETVADPTVSTLPPHLTARAADAGSAAAGAVALAKQARLLPTVLVGPVDRAIGRDPVANDGAPPPSTPTIVFASDVAAFPEAQARSLKPVAQARVPLAAAEDAQIVAFRSGDGGNEHLAIIIGTIDASRPVLARLHSECLTGDLLGSLRCDCGDQLHGALTAISEAGSGVVLYLAQEGRGIGLVNKLRAYQLQDSGFDTLDANGQLGFEDDERLYLPAAEMLRYLGISSVRLLTNNPKKVEALAGHGVRVAERVPHAFAPNRHNRCYLETKARRAGHSL